MQIVYIDLIPQKDKPVVNLSQFDNDRVVRFMLLENGAAYTLAGTEDVEIDIKKPDGNIVVIVPTIGADNYVDVYFTEQAAACYGRSFGEISIHDNSTIIGTCNFYIDVEISPTQGGIESDSAIQNLKRQVDAITMEYLINNTDEIAEVIANKIYPTLEASGDIATFDTILQLPLVSVMATLLATVITRCAKNFYNKTDYPFRQYSIYNPTVCWSDSFYLPAGTYTHSCSTGYGTCFINIYPTKADADANTNRISQLSFADGGSRTETYTSGVWMRVQQNSTGGTQTDYDNVSDAWQIETGSTATAYEPYNGITKPIDDATTIPTLTGTNNVFTDNGPVTVQYKYFPDI